MRLAPSFGEKGPKTGALEAEKRGRRVPSERGPREERGRASLGTGPAGGMELHLWGKTWVPGLLLPRPQTRARPRVQGASLGRSVPRERACKQMGSVPLDPKNEGMGRGLGAEGWFSSYKASIYQGVPGGSPRHLPSQKPSNGGDPLGALDWLRGWEVPRASRPPSPKRGTLGPLSGWAGDPGGTRTRGQPWQGESFRHNAPPVFPPRGCFYTILSWITPKNYFPTLGGPFAAVYPKILAPRQTGPGPVHATGECGKCPFSRVV